ncbi:MAG: type II toxin-antitoxin system VapB family antitoxin [Propionibacteriaceae bacterium]|jgi:antitoxin VapB|nr:type II toxin-antitoxin system VapB family antitoxin [Propionibacteriaceae bacterium]
MPTGTVFRANRTQAVRLPKAVAFPGTVTRVTVEVVGETRVLTPVVSTWAEWFETFGGVDPDFLPDRDQGVAEERDWGEL